MSSINAYSLLHLLQQNQQNSTGQSPQLSNQMPPLMRDLRRTLNASERLVGNLSLDLGVQCTINVDFWNDFGTHGPRQMHDKNSLCAVRFKRGQVLKIDFGHLNIGREQAFAHMAIVLGNFKGLVIVVPIQSDRNQNFPNDTQDMVLKLSAQGHPFLTRDSLVLVQQVQAVSKNRIYKDTGYSLYGDPVMLDIENKMLQYFAPLAKKVLKDEIKQLTDEVATKNQIIDQLESEIITKNSELATFRTLVQDLQAQLVSKSGNVAATLDE